MSKVIEKFIPWHYDTPRLTVHNWWEFRNKLYEDTRCGACGGSGFTGRGTGYDDVCSTCAGGRSDPDKRQFVLMPSEWLFSMPPQTRIVDSNGKQLWILKSGVMSSAESPDRARLAKFADVVRLFMRLVVDQLPDTWFLFPWLRKTHITVKIGYRNNVIPLFGPVRTNDDLRHFDKIAGKVIFGIWYHPVEELDVLDGLRCPRCCYTAGDQFLNGDHRLCNGQIPYPTIAYITGSRFVNHKWIERIVTDLSVDKRIHRYVDPVMLDMSKYKDPPDWFMLNELP